GEQLQSLGFFYAEAIHAAWGDQFDVLFGPAYKGIVLAAATSVALFQNYAKNGAYCFNRKEAKDHGEGGALVGHRLRDGDRVIIVEDVITAGTSIRETVPFLLAAAKVRLCGLIVSVDRMEKGAGAMSALQEVQQGYSMPVRAIVTVDEIVSFLYKKVIDGVLVIDDETKKRIDSYRSQYGV
ncbi:MAG: orotate phosphoribosyltransferase, partial [Chitinivibrionales bacterium]|nr:orotate phosphoribosyltransferase [Chitinivibrionales bacterium]